jgi:hypothetical protein
MTITAKTFAKETRRHIEDAGTSDWIDIYHRIKTESDSFVVFGAFVAETAAQKELRNAEWGHDLRGLVPACTEYAQGRVQYDVHGNDQGYQPIVLERSFYGMKPPHKEMSEEFRLFHNLYFDSKNHKYIKIRDDGSEQDVIRIEDERISIRSIEMKQFLAVKEARLGLFWDIRHHYKNTRASQITEHREVKTEQGPDFIYTTVIADGMVDSSFIRILGKKLIRGFDKKDSDVWPYNERREEPATYMEFIVGTDDRGKEKKLPCDPHRGNYLTPVFFRGDVLNRYYDNPTKYSVEDGYLRCGDLWGVQIDNDNPENVAVFLGDIGRDIPESEHGYWRSFNIAPSGSLSETAIRRSFLSEFTDPKRMDLVFKRQFIVTQDAWKRKHGWLFFRPFSEEDEHCYSSLRIPANAEQNELDTQVMYLAKLMVDSLNEREIAKTVKSVPNQKGIDKLEAYLGMKGFPNYEEHIQFLRDLQSLRSTGAAHRKGKNYEKTAKRLDFEHKDQRLIFTELLERAIFFLNSLKALSQ